MSSTTTPNTKSVEATPTPTSQPVQLLSTQPSQFYANLHPALLLSLLLFNFSSLVADPVNTLIALAPLVLIIQAAYCIICLPPAGRTSPPPPKPGQKKKAADPMQDIWDRAVPAFLSFILTFVLSAPLLYIFVILFGAPLTTHHPHTLLLALHLALLTTPQLYYAHGLDGTKWLKIASLQLPVDEVLGLSIGAFVGAWVGAIPIPLDWDREWQKWPVTIIAGLYGGAVVGKLAGGYLFRGAMIKIS